MVVVTIRERSYRLALGRSIQETQSEDHDAHCRPIDRLNQTIEILNQQSKRIHELESADSWAGHGIN